VREANASQAEQVSELRLDPQSRLLPGTDGKATPTMQSSTFTNTRLGLAEQRVGRVIPSVSTTSDSIEHTLHSPPLISLPHRSAPQDLDLSALASRRSNQIAVPAYRSRNDRLLDRRQPQSDPAMRNGMGSMTMNRKLDTQQNDMNVNVAQRNYQMQLQAQARQLAQAQANQRRGMTRVPNQQMSSRMPPTQAGMAGQRENDPPGLSPNWSSIPSVGPQEKTQILPSIMLSRMDTTPYTMKAGPRAERRREAWLRPSEEHQLLRVDRETDGLHSLRTRTSRGNQSGFINADPGPEIPCPTLFMAHTISQDRTGNQSEVLAKILAPARTLVVLADGKRRATDFDSPLSAQSTLSPEVSPVNPRVGPGEQSRRGQDSLQLRQYSWSCAAISSAAAAFHPSESEVPEGPPTAMTDVCGFCGSEFPNFPTPDWDLRTDHLKSVHSFDECDQKKKFYRGDHFSQHLKHSHAGTSGKWTTMLLRAASVRERPTPQTSETIAQPSERSVYHSGLQVPGLMRMSA
jgi:hypothetical protein